MSAPGKVGVNAGRLDKIDALVEADIAAKKLPGAVVLVGHKGKIVFRRAYGNRSLVPTVEKMTVDTIFDLASLTKPIATATSIWILIEQGKLQLTDTVVKFIPEIEDEQAKKVTIQQLLTHTSGYAPDLDLREAWPESEGQLTALYKEKLRTLPGGRFLYSDIGFIVLGEIVNRLSDTELKTFSRESIFDPLGIRSTGFIEHFGVQNQSLNMSTPIMTLNPFIGNQGKIAPTENVRGQKSYLGTSFKFERYDGAEDYLLRGQVHDPTAFRMGGVAGHAGLFSTADDLARYCQMILNGGLVPGSPPYARSEVSASRGRGSSLGRSKTAKESIRILSAATVARMTAPIVVSDTGETRTLGWDMNTAFSTNRGDLFPLGSFGHTGFTGTGIWIDPVSQTFVVFLSNRVHPDGKGDVTALRGKISTVVASAIEDTPIEKIREAEAGYNAAVAAQLERFRATNNERRTTNVLNGIDILERDNFKPLAGMRIGLVTNHTGRDLSGKQTIDILKAAPDVKLVALFSPEHGIRGQADEKVGDSLDEKTGLPVYSLYGDTSRPKPEQLKDLDVVVYDIQDIGTRFYTYTSTLRNVMEEAAKAGKSVFVLDRPDPLNGAVVEGPVAYEDQLSFIAAHTVPVRYGMTIGELAGMMNTERKIGADLRVVKMEGWSRSMWFDETGQTWINPSPNMRSLTEATLYPGIGLLETTNVSVGRGTDTPFELVGAPWLDGQKLGQYLNGQRLRGVRFVPVRFTPNASTFKGEECGGINIVVTNRVEFSSVRTGMEIAAALRKLYPDVWEIDKYARLLVNPDSFGRLKRGEAPAIIEKEAEPSLGAFLKRRAASLLYR